ncbi:MAG: SMC-Scp complex subunit ScpB [Synergistaceae bacterium]|nr:SMC-Scp complex subunit ScpB [Synergistaceae bacterium]
MSKMNYSQMSELARKVEALLFVSPSPVTERELREALGVSGRELSNALSELADVLDGENHGVYLRNIAGDWVIETRPELSETVGNFRDNAGKKRVRLSRAAIETAAVIASKQPVTRSEIDEIRGVNSGSPLAKLLELGLVRTAGRKKEGRPSLLYVTTVKFLEVFGINEIADIPAPEEIDTEEEST